MKPPTYSRYSRYSRYSLTSTYPAAAPATTRPNVNTPPTPSAAGASGNHEPGRGAVAIPGHREEGGREEDWGREEGEREKGGREEGGREGGGREGGTETKRQKENRREVGGRTRIGPSAAAGSLPYTCAQPNSVVCVCVCV